jgi:uncharacterized protein (TIGR02246 family)
MRRLFWVGCSVMLLSSLLMGQSGNADEDAIRKLDVAWSAAAGSRDVDKTISFYADDGSVLPHGAPIATGKAQIKEVWTHILTLPGVKLSFEPSKITVAKAKDMAYEIGTYQLTVNDAQGNPSTEIGKFVVIWKKQPDKQWKVVVDIFNADK